MFGWETFIWKKYWCNYRIWYVSKKEEEYNCQLHDKIAVSPKVMTTHEKKLSVHDFMFGKGAVLKGGSEKLI